MIVPLILSLLTAPVIAESAPNIERVRAKHNAPKQGAYAPDFLAYRLSDGKPVNLSGIIGARPVVLVFGSYT